MKAVVQRKPIQLQFELPIHQLADNYCNSVRTIGKLKMNLRAMRGLMIVAALASCAGYAVAAEGGVNAEASWWSLAAGGAVFGEAATLSVFLLMTLCGLAVDGLGDLAGVGGTVQVVLVTLGVVLILATVSFYWHRRSTGMSWTEDEGVSLADDSANARGHH